MMFPCWFASLEARQDPFITFVSVFLYDSELFRIKYPFSLKSLVNELAVAIKGQLLSTKQIPSCLIRAHLLKKSSDRLWPSERNAKFSAFGATRTYIIWKAILYSKFTRVIVKTPLWSSSSSAQILWRATSFLTAMSFEFYWTEYRSKWYPARTNNSTSAPLSCLFSSVKLTSSKKIMS